MKNIQGREEGWNDSKFMKFYGRNNIWPKSYFINLGFISIRGLDWCWLLSSSFSGFGSAAFSGRTRKIRDFLRCLPRSFLIFSRNIHQLDCPTFQQAFEGFIWIFLEVRFLFVWESTCIFFVWPWHIYQFSFNSFRRLEGHRLDDRQGSNPSKDEFFFSFLGSNRYRWYWSALINRNGLEWGKMCSSADVCLCMVDDCWRSSWLIRKLLFSRFLPSFDII